MKVKVLDHSFEVPAKRLYLPIVLESFCPKCKNRNVLDLNDDYVSYPKFNAVENIHFYCNECDHEYGELLKISISAESMGCVSEN